jgi:3-oxoacyl-(acyl-carrier-protein) synthase
MKQKEMEDRGRVAMSLEFPELSLLKSKCVSADIAIRREQLAGKKDIAVIGMDLKFPQADNVEEFWSNLINSRDCIGKLPENRRRDLDRYVEYVYPDGYQADYPEIAYLDAIDQFDSDFFHISPKEASLMDPNQRLFLESVWKAIEDSGYGGDRLVGSRTGVYVGYKSSLSNTYLNMVAEVEREFLAMAAPGNKPAILASRIAYLLDLRGPAMLIDTACSSALVAIHLACQALRNRECSLAIAGGIRLDILPICNGAKMGIESADGRARAFDDGSDGTGGGEGVAAVILKSLDAAIADQDHIYAVIKGSAVNQDGKSIGITAPNAAAQEDVIVNAWKDAAIEPETIGYIEAHGTGTKLGDPIEIEGITRAFGNFTAKKQFCALGAVKTNIGHLDNASGMAGLIKAALVLRNKQIPPLLHFRRPNSRIDFIHSPVYVNDRLEAWESDRHPRRCGVSAFGLSGTNCHIVLEEAPVLPKPGNAASEVRVFTLSAHSEASFSMLLQKYIKFLTKGTEHDLKAICYTANTGRGHYGHRLAIIAADHRELAVKLRTFKEARQEMAEEGIFYSVHTVVPYTKETEPGEITEAQKRALGSAAAPKIKQYCSGGNREMGVIREICRLYVRGAEIRWSEFYDGGVGKVSLPSYEFERRRCWLNIPSVPKSPIAAGMDSSNEMDATFATATVLKGKRDGYTPVEAMVGRIWSEVLGLTAINVYSDLYELGGDSLIAMKIANQMKQTSGLDVGVAEILGHSTVADLAGHIEWNLQAETENKEDIYAGLRPVETAEFYELSSSQKRMFVMDWFEGIGSVYNMNRVMLVKGDLAVNRVETIFREIVKRHDSLRTSFGLVEGKPMQRIHPAVDFRVDWFEAEESQIGNIVTAFIRPFDLKEPPLLRLGLIRLSSDRHVLMIDMHHIISDGTSTVIIMREFRDLYEGRKPPAMKLQYKDYAVWANRIINLPAMQRQQRFWMDIFGDRVPVLALPADYPRPPMRSFAGAKAGSVLAPGLTRRLREFALENDFTLHMVLLGTYYVLLAKYAEQEDIVVGIATSGRNHSDLEGIVGMFVNTLAIRNYPKADKTFIEFLREVKSTSLSAYENQDYPLEELVDRLCGKRDVSRNPLFDAVFTLTKHHQIEVEGLDFQVLDLEEIKARFDLILSMCEYERTIGFDFIYGARLFRSDTIAKMALHFQTIVATGLENPAIKLGDIQLLADSEKQRLLNGGETQEARPKRDGTVNPQRETELKAEFDF